MKFFSRIVTAVVFSASFVLPVVAQTRATKEDAVAIVKKAIAYYKENGREKVLAEINNKNPLFVRGDLYITAAAVDGPTLAHPFAPKMIGKSMVDLKDADGKPFAREMDAIGKSGKPGWVDFRWINPVTKEIESKTSYVETYEKISFIAGVYR